MKLEVLGDKKTLLPDPVGTLEATEVLVKEGFTVLCYTSDDPVMARRLKDAGAASVMPAGSPIGTGQGVLNPNNIRIFLEDLKEDDPDYPVIVDAGVGTASDVAIAMELGCDGVLLNTGIAARPRPAAHGPRHAAGLRGRLPGRRRGPHPAQALRHGLQPARRGDRGPLSGADRESKGVGRCWRSPRRPPDRPCSRCWSGSPSSASSCSPWPRRWRWRCTGRWRWSPSRRRKWSTPRPRPRPRPPSPRPRPSPANRSRSVPPPARPATCARSPLVQLIADPEDFDGERVRVEGFLHVKFEDNALYLHREDADHLVGRNAAWISFDGKVGGDPSAFDRRYVLVEGVFRADEHGHMGAYSGTIEDVNRVMELEQRYPEGPGLP